MKSLKTTSTSKLITRFDNDLKNILMEDLKNFKAKNQFVNSNKQASLQQELKAA